VARCGLLLVFVAQLFLLRHKNKLFLWRTEPGPPQKNFLWRIFVQCATKIRFTYKAFPTSVRCFRRVRLKIHKAAVSARVLLRASVCWFHLLPLRRLRRWRSQEMFVGVSAQRSLGFFVFFFFCEVFCAKCRNICCLWSFRVVYASVVR
jgi:hypothetical protein